MFCIVTSSYIVSQVFNYSRDQEAPETTSDNSPPPPPPLDILEIQYGIGEGGEYLVQAENMPPIFTYNSSPNNIGAETLKVPAQCATTAVVAPTQCATTTTVTVIPTPDPAHCNINPQPGIYVKGIYVIPPVVPGVIMSFCSSRLEVIGRDRNDVDRTMVRERRGDVYACQ
jgi:hypothetical protein